MMMMAFCENFKYYRNCGGRIYCMLMCYESLTTKEDIVVKINGHKIQNNEMFCNNLIIDSQPNFPRIIEISGLFVETWIEISVYTLELRNQYDNGKILTNNQL